MNKPLISVIVPCYNEETRLAKSLDAMLSYLPNKFPSWEIIAVDDGSTDATWTILETYQHTFSHFRAFASPHMGKGYATKCGMREASGRYRMFLDADLSTPLYEIERGLTELSLIHI